ncbi:OLC1v1001183C1 [Oldenlandia corymbosa var. corymbosa]|uniref:OLC1v1001183C1 n=1 Tax=Oldenlandia corymbosa var. corymbosa TaxID=529605 RepID=A0AAV1D4R7_OLDCO|nr:OLC1v1001183C1 [Oldenlandia corymbosa var. corymbosa]
MAAPAASVDYLSDAKSSNEDNDSYDESLEMDAESQGVMPSSFSLIPKSPPSEDMMHDHHLILEVFAPIVPDVPRASCISPLSVLDNNWSDSVFTANDLNLSREGSVQSGINNRGFCMHISSSDESVSLDKKYRNSLKVKCNRIKKGRKQRFSQDLPKSVSTDDDSAMQSGDKDNCFMKIKRVVL